MSKTEGRNTPGGTPMETLGNPLSDETGSKDSGEGRPLHTKNSQNMEIISSPFERRGRVTRSPEKTFNFSFENPNIEKIQNNMGATAAPQQAGITTSYNYSETFVLESCSSEKEQMLYKQWQKVTDEKNQQSIIILNLQQQIDELKKEMMQLKQHKTEANPSMKQNQNTKFNVNNGKCQIEPPIMQNQNTNSNVNKHVEYQTDEEDLAKETEWIRAKSRKNKKRRLNNTPSPPQKPQKLDQNTQPQKVETSVKKDKKIPPPPPIIVDDVKDYHAFYDIIKASVSDESFITKLMNQNKISINVNSGDAYRNVVKTLSEGSFIFHTYENKQERPIRVMARNLHHTCDPERIKDELSSKQYKIISVMNKISWRKKKKLDMFVLTFSCDENITKIYKITSLLGCKVEIQPLRKSKLIPQCKRCQAYGHTQKYCGKLPRCVKCAGHHLTGECDNPQVHLKCVHCGQGHPANYRGCIVAKEIQKIKIQRMNKTQMYGQANQYERLTKQDNGQPFGRQLRTEGVTYAEATRGVVNKPQQKSIDVAISQTLQDILMKLTKFDERLQKLEDRALGAKPKSTQK